MIRMQGRYDSPWQERIALLRNAHSLHFYRSLSAPPETAISRVHGKYTCNIAIMFNMISEKGKCSVSVRYSSVITKIRIIYF